MSLLDIESNLEDQTTVIRSWIKENCVVTANENHWDVIPIKKGYGIIYTGDNENYLLSHREVGFKKVPPFKLYRCDFSISILEPCDRLDFLPERIETNLIIRDNNSITDYSGLPDWVGGTLDLSGCQSLVLSDSRYFPNFVGKILYLYNTDFDKLNRQELYRYLEHVDVGMSWETRHLSGNGADMRDYRL